MKDELRIGVLTSIDWNSYRWKKYPKEEDILNAKYQYVRENGTTHTYLNFACDIPDSKGLIYALLPQFWSKTPRSQNLKIAFIRSQSWRDKKTYIVGLHFLPEFVAPDSRLLLTSQDQRVVNIRTFPKNTILLNEDIELTSTNISSYLPAGKSLGKQGFNYMTKENAVHLLTDIIKLNPSISRLDEIIKELKY